VVVATEMVVVGVRVIVSRTRGAVTGRFDIQETYGDVVGGGKPCFFNLMCNRENGIEGKACHHRYQGQCNDFSEFKFQAVSDP